MLHKHLHFASALLLAACSPTQPSPDPSASAESSSGESPAVESPAVESPLAGDLRILGTEPFWGCAATPELLRQTLQ